MSGMTHEELELLSRSACDFAEERSPVGRIRALRDERDPLGWCRVLWAEMAELGWTGLSLPENRGGWGLGFSEQCVLLEAVGRNLVPEPLLTTAVSAQVLMMSDVLAAQAQLSAIAAGEATVTIASEEGHYSHGGLQGISTRWVDGGLVGEKTGVPDGVEAAAYLVVAQDDEGSALYLVDGSAPGVERTRQWRVDGRNAVTLTLDGVPGERLGGEELVIAAYDRGAIALAAEMLGAATRAFEITLEYLKTREQFGVTIGSFQALQHRAARMYIELGLLRSVVRGAAAAVDGGSDDVSRMASLAKVVAGETFTYVANQSIQLHGGIGMTDEHDIGLYLKRARVCEVTWGTATWHRRRWAELGGY